MTKINNPLIPVGIALFALLLAGCGGGSVGDSVKSAYDHAFQRQSPYQGSVQDVRAAARRGNPDAQYALGYMYYYGNGGLPRNVGMARTWIRRAAAQGQPQAIRAMRMMHFLQSPTAARVYGAGGRRGGRVRRRARATNARSQAAIAKGWDSGRAPSVSETPVVQTDSKAAGSK